MKLWQQKAQQLLSHKYFRHLVLMWRQSWWAFVLCFGVLISVLGDFKDSDSAPSAPALDTFIPKGHVLVPLELSNHKAISSLLGAYGVVDLYLAPQDPYQQAPKKPRPNLRAPVAQQVRIVRSPHSASHFAVLVPQNAVAQLMQLGARFHAVLQNPNAAPRLEIRDQASHNIQIVVEDESKSKP